ncbi:AAA family ATPase [Mucilaginibacter sp. BJC16-A38]|uniref:HRDC domain-containing protein n=1 Tax=Mucilaginibacter phenanthrenivorans TaxID=1234842 RepID=UPI0021584BB6|nr:HRDC domain-containing protein [Mucilaginibacter phenanthrenivorans]MCR8556716.1 AAA family ATPase [Mucilaginibacter phenanthrenivorans]
MDTSAKPELDMILAPADNMTELNPVMQLAYDYLTDTNTIVFLTGKAGTGKTTFLQRVKQESKKKLAVVAPTGVAAINAGGMTIHSLFQIPFGPIIPGGNSRPDAHYSTEKKELLSSLELLIIDEVSMVRPDVLDQIDLILRNLKDCAHPFGGVQLLLIGDLSQLSPIIRDEEWIMLNRYYATPYFFSSQVMQKAPFVRIELNHVFRQKEQAFVDILNEVRNQTISSSSLELLNARHLPGFRPTIEEPYITLTTHNSLAQQINSEFVEVLDGEEFEFKATIRGEFPKDAYPTETNLKLKIGAQVMFVKNHGSAEKLFYNGKIGTVIRIENDTVFVQCGNEGREIAVQAVEWTNIKYQLEEQQISETNAGSFAQIPLKLAWAITIHKSQGLSFDRAIIDVSEAFTHGQAYVALSRCRTLSGMVLRNPITTQNIIGDPAISLFNEQAKALQPDALKLEQDRELYKLFLISELFNFNGLKTKVAGFEELIPDLQKDILGVSGKFTRQLAPERVQKAAVYFYEKLKSAIEVLHGQLPGMIGQSKEKAAKADRLINWMMVRMELMDCFSTVDFTPFTYLDRKKNGATTQTSSYLKILNAKPNEKLYDEFLTWRNVIAEKEQIMPNMVLSEKTLAAVAEKLPSTLKLISAIKGVGPQKTNQYGTDLITLIRSYQQKEQGSDTEQKSLF